jgi:hypothetical protein
MRPCGFLLSYHERTWSVQEVEGKTLIPKSFLTPNPIKPNYEVRAGAGKAMAIAI